MWAKIGLVKKAVPGVATASLVQGNDMVPGQGMER